MTIGTSIFGTKLSQNLTGPACCTPARTTAPSVMNASTPVTLMLPVALAPPGIIPSRLQKRTKKKSVQRYGRNWSEARPWCFAPWPWPSS